MISKSLGATSVILEVYLHGWSVRREVMGKHLEQGCHFRTKGCNSHRHQTEKMRRMRFL